MHPKCDFCENQLRVFVVPVSWFLVGSWENLGAFIAGSPRPLATFTLAAIIGVTVLLILIVKDRKRDKTITIASSRCVSGEPKLFWPFSWLSWKMRILLALNVAKSVFNSVIHFRSSICETSGNGSLVRQILQQILAGNLDRFVVQFHQFGLPHFRQYTSNPKYSWLTLVSPLRYCHFFFLFLQNSKLHHD